MSRDAPPITPLDGAVRERMRDLLSLHAVQAKLAPLKVAIGFGQIDRALDIVVAADEARGAVLEGLGLSRAALMHQCLIVLREIGRSAT